MSFPLAMLASLLMSIVITTDRFSTSDPFAEFSTSIHAATLDSGWPTEDITEMLEKGFALPRGIEPDGDVLAGDQHPDEMASSDALWMPDLIDGTLQEYDFPNNADSSNTPLLRDEKRTLVGETPTIKERRFKCLNCEKCFSHVWRS